jgi:hypothetical protein
VQRRFYVISIYKKYSLLIEKQLTITAKKANNYVILVNMAPMARTIADTKEHWLVFFPRLGKFLFSHGYQFTGLCTCSNMSRKGDPYDNSVVENFFSCLKCELVYLQHFQSRSQAIASIFTYIKAFYNAIRPHSALSWISPNAFSHKFLFPVA